jgi:DNA-binding XRE family transcriptional regulator
MNMKLSIEDRQDLCPLLPDLLSGDDEARQSAAEAIDEILHGPSLKLIPFEDVEGSDDDLAPWLNRISKRIREAREAAGLTQAELSQQSGLPQSHISRLEQGKHSPTAKTLEKIATALKLPHSHIDPSA